MNYKSKKKKDFKLFKFTLLLSVTLIFDWLVISRTGALMISCLELWIASASILIICQLISLKVKTFKDRKKEKNTLMQDDSLLAPNPVRVYVYICPYVHTNSHEPYKQNKYNSLVIPLTAVRKCSPHPACHRNIKLLPSRLR